jgi:hypothetical protein
MGSASAFSMRPWYPLQRSQRDQEISFSILKEIMGSTSAVSMRLRKLVWHSGNLSQHDDWLSFHLQGIPRKWKERKNIQV